jgi:hypothetical protein
MAQLLYQGLYDDMVAGNFTSSADLRIMLVMTNTTCDTEADAQNLSDFTTIDECDGVGYAQRDLASVAVAYDAANDRLGVDAADADMTGDTDSIAVSTRDVSGYVVYRYVDGTDANDVPWGYIDVGPYTLSGGDFTITFPTAGVLYWASA